MTMNIIAINDMPLSKDLDQQAMSALTGGWTFTNYSNNTYGSWSTVSDTTVNGGYQYIGTVRYRIRNRRIRRQRTQRRTSNYTRLEFDGYL